MSAPLLAPVGLTYSRRVQTSLDKSKTPHAFIESLLQIPIFIEYADACMRAVVDAEVQHS